jgi:hypothetical protein
MVEIYRKTYWTADGREISEAEFEELVAKSSHLTDVQKALTDCWSRTRASCIIATMQAQAAGQAMSVQEVNDICVRTSTYAVAEMRKAFKEGVFDAST